MQKERTAEGRGLLLPLLVLVLLALGLALAVGGIKLVALGGSVYYVVAGLLLIASGVQAWRRRAASAGLYALLLVVTIAWAVMESGFDHWALAPRLGLLLGIGVVFLLPGIRRRIGAAPLRPFRAVVVALVAAGLGYAAHVYGGFAVPDPALAGGLTAAPAANRLPGLAGADGDWLHYGNDDGGSRFSPLDQINATNVDKLQVAWTYRTEPDGKPKAFLEVTPLKVGNSLYLCTGTSDVIALDAETGKQRWRYNAGVEFNEHFKSGNCRGVGYFKAPAGSATAECAERIIAGSIDAKLVALDAQTGRLCPGFGEGGRVDLTRGMGQVTKRYYFTSSAPTLVRGKIVIGGWIADNQSTNEPSGVIRAFDAVTGKLSWAFDVGRPDRSGEPGPGEQYTRGTPNSWGPMSADPELGLVFAPTGNPPPDFVGAHRRPFDEKFGAAVVAIDVDTGHLRWVYQTVHHDLWDYDVATQPLLVDFPTPTGPRKAVIQGTKRGQIFVLDRATGTPLTPVVEEPVPHKQQVPGEWPSPTQPFSVGMPQLIGPRLAEWRMWGVTPVDQLWCRVKFRTARYEGTFTPPGLVPNVIYPGYGGGMNWGSTTIDKDRGLLLAMNVRAPFYQRLIPRAEADKMGLAPMGDKNWKDEKSQLAAMAGTPYGLDSGPFLSPLGVPCNQPPYGLLTAVDLKTRKVVWQRPIGDARSMGPLGFSSHIPAEIGIPLVGGSMATRGGLTFIAAAVDGSMRALDTNTGKTLWQTQLPAGGNAIPMTYLSADGRQYVVIAAGGHYAAPRGDYVIAFALPRKGGAN